MNYKTSKKRGTSAIVFICVVFAVFLVHLFNVQVIGTDEENQSAVSVVSVSVPSIRGEILDRNGYPLVTNKQVNKIVFNYLAFPKDYTERNKIMLELIRIFRKNKVEWKDNLPILLDKNGKLVFDKDKPNEVSYLKSEAFLDLNYYADVEDCFNALVSKYKLEEYSLKDARNIASVYYSMVKDGFNTGRNYEFATDVSSALVSAVKERSDQFPGVDVQVSSERDYYDGTLAPHVLGIVANISDAEYESKKDQGYTITDMIGKSGIEAIMESYLRGKNGVKTITTDADGNKTETYTEMPEQGNTVVLTISRDLQKVAQDALAEGIQKLQISTERSYRLTGSVVVMDTRNNEVLAIASYPTYDNSTYQEDYSKLLADVSKPLWNRALKSTYTPGSTIKPAVALAGLEEGLIKGNEGIVCTGIYNRFGDYKPRCTKVHGYQNVVNAIYNSCNIYFYETAHRLGIEKLNSYFSMFGLGEPTGIELSESEGIVDNPAHRKSVGDTWTRGLTVQAGIGHGDNQFTPIQLCSYVSTIANKGTRYKAHLIKSVKSSDLSETVMETESQVLSKANFSDENWDLVHRGMLLVGTQSYANFSNVPCKVAAKTGTTTVSKKVNGRKIETYNGFLITFAPYEKPEIAVCVSVEGAGSGGSTAPIVSAILEHYFAQKDTQENIQYENSLLK